MSVPLVLQRGDFACKADDMPYNGVKHEALRRDPDVSLDYVEDGDTVGYTDLEGPPDAVAEELAAVDPRVAVLGADRVLHLNHGMDGRTSSASAAYTSSREKQVWTGPAATYAVVVDETRAVAAGLVPEESLEFDGVRYG
ncbi:MAG: hypothetical protein SVW77_01795 [Candidatus Nanohaloarchaea archaeon]|nr:hypothetical protein [Candidatus Nanohaloarchaea archaeon]